MSFINEVTSAVKTVGKVVKETYGPLAALDGNNYTPSDLRYPLDVGDPKRYPHTIEFQTWKPIQVPITDMGVVQATQDTAGNILERGIQTAKHLYKEVVKGLPGEVYKPKPGEPIPDYMSMKVNRNQRYNDRLLDWTRRAERSDLITLFMPQGPWIDRATNQYAQTGMTAAWGLAGFMLENGVAISKENISTWDMVNGPGGMEAAGAIASKLPGGMDGGTLANAGLQALGYAVNPQFEMLYGGTDLREFMFEFTLTPRNEKEAEVIRKIIKRLKYHASPEMLSGQGRYMVPPSYFDITFNFNGRESEWLPTISTCVLKAIDIDYSGGLDTWSTHADGSPIQTKITMSFQELELIHKKLRKLGY